MRKPVRIPKVSMKKTCRGCSALGFSHGGFQEVCDLGYWQEWKNERYPRPLLPCPKPLSNREWLQCEHYTPPNTACTRQGQVAPQFDNFE